MKRRMSIIIFAVSCLGTSCQSVRDSTLVGTGFGSLIGGVFGGLAGAHQGRAGEGAAIGSFVGAAVGGMSGFLWHKENESRAQGDEGRRDEAGVPALSKPRVRRVWVPDRIEGDRLVKGHFVYEIEQPSTWRLDDGK